jgi:hypothetical protein
MFVVGVIIAMFVVGGSLSVFDLELLDVTEEEQEQEQEEQEERLYLRSITQKVRANERGHHRSSTWNCLIRRRRLRSSIPTVTLP